MSRPVVIQIDLAAMSHNLRRTRAFAPQSKIIAMIKANGYGHGIADAAKALAGADAFGVASIEEALAIREAGVSQPVILMQGVFAAEELSLAAQRSFSLVVHNQEQLAMLHSLNNVRPLQVWLKVDTGMHRLGIKPGEVSFFYQALSRLDVVAKPIGLMTHFAQADNLTCQSTHQQIALFEQLKQGISGPASMANSAGILAWKESHADWVRPGLMLYGVSPFTDKVGADFDLKPAMQLTTRLISVYPVARGDRVGYGASWRAEKDSKIGIVAMGYGDGYPQFASNDTPILVNGALCSLAGRVSMDMLAVNLTNQPDAKVGDEVLLWGRELPVEQVARGANTSPYELLTRMTARPKRYTLL